MGAIKKLLNQEEAYSTEGYRKLQAISVGNYFLSIQGSSTHYCYPRHTLPVNRYVNMELAIINKKGSMISINKSSVLRKFKRYNELIRRADGINTESTVYGYVSVDLLNDLYNFLNETNLKRCNHFMLN